MSVPVIVDVDVDSEGGTIQATLQQWMTIQGRRVVVLGDPIPSHEGVMIQGSLWHQINGIPVCRMGDATSCGHTAIGTQFWWLIS